MFVDQEFWKMYVMQTLLVGMICAKKKKRTKNMPDLELAELPESDYEEEQTDDLECAKKKASEGVIVFPCGIIMKKRNKQKVMYWHHIPLNKDSEEHYRQQIMLFTAWIKNRLKFAAKVKIWGNPCWANAIF